MYDGLYLYTPTCCAYATLMISDGLVQAPLRISIAHVSPHGGGSAAPSRASGAHSSAKCELPHCRHLVVCSSWHRIPIRSL
jgi:hypothetical protein